MANVKISELPVAASVDGASSFPVVEGGVTKQVTFTGMLASPSLFASGMATFFATPSSANLRAALTDETGTGAAVFADSPTLTGAVSVTGTVAATKLIPTGNVTAGNGMYLPAANEVAISTNGTEQVRVNAVGDVTFAGDLFLANANALAWGSGDGSTRIEGNSSTDVLTLFTVGAERVRVDTSGNVGIGTNAPSEKLNVQGTAAGSAFAVRFSNTSSTANSAAVLSLDPGNNGFNVRDGQIRAINNGANQISLAFFTSSAATPAEAMRIDASGNALVGTTTANARLTVSGSVSWTTGASFAGAAGNAVWSTGFGSQAINASIQASDSIAGANIYAISDVRLKNNIKPIPSGLAFVNEIDAVQFTWKESGIEDTGFIAQDLLKKGFGHLVSAIPDGSMQELVHEDGNVSPAGSRFVVKYDSVVPILCKAIQEQQTIINDLRARVAALEA